MGRRERADLVLHLRESGQAGKIHIAERHAAADEMDVRIVESRRHRAAVGIDHARLRPAKSRHGVVGADEQDLVARRGDRLRRRAPLVGREDPAVDDHQVGRLPAAGPGAGAVPHAAAVNASHATEIRQFTKALLCQDAIVIDLATAKDILLPCTPLRVPTVVCCPTVW